MGTFYTGCKIENVSDRSKGSDEINLTVDPKKKKLVASGPLLAA
jgi:hypothetical protein